MKKLISVFVLFGAMNAQAAYICKTPTLNPFELRSITMDTLDVDLDGNLDGSATVLSNGMLEYSYNNGCDNDITIRVSKVAIEAINHGWVKTFNLKMDYLDSDTILTDIDVICDKVE